MRLSYSLTKTPMGVFHYYMTSGKIIVCLTGLALLIRLYPRDVKIFPNRVFFTATLGSGFKNTPIYGEIMWGCKRSGLSAQRKWNIQNEKVSLRALERASLINVACLCPLAESRTGQVDKWITARQSNIIQILIFSQCHFNNA